LGWNWWVVLQEGVPGVSIQEINFERVLVDEDIELRSLDEVIRSLIGNAGGHGYQLLNGLAIIGSSLLERPV